MRKSITSVASVARQPRWAITFMLVAGVLVLMGMRIIDPEMGLTFLGGQAAGLGAMGIK